MRPTRSKYTREQRRESMRETANATRDSADEMAAMYGGCDDPLHPWRQFVEPQPWSNWIEFAQIVCLPIALAEDDDAVQAAMKLYRKANPHFVATCLVMAANRAGVLEMPEP